MRLMEVAGLQPRPFEGYVESVGTGIGYSNELQKRSKRSVPSVSRGRSVVAISPL